MDYHEADFNGGKLGLFTLPLPLYCWDDAFLYDYSRTNNKKLKKLVAAPKYKYLKYSQVQILYI